MSVVIGYSANGAPIHDVPNKKLKHILCNNVTRGRKCPHQDKCWYSHSEEERSSNLIKKACRYLRADGTCSKPNCKFDHSIKPVTVISDEKIQKPCNFLKDDGSCKYGDKCKFSHDRDFIKKFLSTSDEEQFVIDFNNEEETVVEEIVEETIVEECESIVEESMYQDVMSFIEAHTNINTEVREINLEIHGESDEEIQNIIEKIQTLILSSTNNSQLEVTIN